MLVAGVKFSPDLICLGSLQKSGALRSTDMSRGSPLAPVAPLASDPAKSRCKAAKLPPTLATYRGVRPSRSGSKAPQRPDANIMDSSLGEPGVFENSGWHVRSMAGTKGLHVFLSALSAKAYFKIGDAGADASDRSKKSNASFIGSLSSLTGRAIDSKIAALLPSLVAHRSRSWVCNLRRHPSPLSSSTWSVPSNSFMAGSAYFPFPDVHHRAHSSAPTASMHLSLIPGPETVTLRRGGSVHDVRTAL